MLTKSDVQAATGSVLKNYNKYVSVDILTTYINRSDIFSILQKDQFNVKFDLHVRWFEAVLEAEVSVRGVDAFVSPEADHKKRSIYVKVGGDETQGVLIHEFIHWLSHENFYPHFYSRGGNAPDIVEGMTEYFTRKLFPDRTFYQNEYSMIKGISQYEDQMLDALFSGNKTAIDQISAHVSSKIKAQDKGLAKQ